MLNIPLSHIIPGSELTSPCAILLMPRIELESDKYQICKSFVSLNRQAGWRIVGCMAAKQTSTKHMAHVEALSVAMEAVSFSTVQLMFET